MQGRGSQKEHVSSYDMSAWFAGVYFCYVLSINEVPQQDLTIQLEEGLRGQKQLFVSCTGISEFLR